VARAITHVGLTVPDIHGAVAWYGRVLGFRVLAQPALVDRGDPIAADVFGLRFGQMWIAQLAAGGDCALELFEFVDPPTRAPADTFDYWVGGFFHICVVDPDVERLARQIAASGGRIRSARAWEMHADARPAGADPYLTMYCEDPWGNILELYSHPHEQVYGPPSP
jgi:catechol 2,3-dioxygenase-like lactoylglutathione lyase family enzyme